MVTREMRRMVSWLEEEVSSSWMGKRTIGTKLKIQRRSFSFTSE